MTNVVKALLFDDMMLPKFDDFPWPVFDPLPSNVEDKAADEDAKSDSDAGSSLGTLGTKSPTKTSANEEKVSETKEEAKARKKAEKEGEKIAKQTAKLEKARASEREKARKRGEPVMNREEEEERQEAAAAAFDALTPSRTPRSGRSTSSGHVHSSDPRPAIRDIDSDATQLQRPQSLGALDEQSPEPADPWGRLPSVLTTATPSWIIVGAADLVSNGAAVKPAGRAGKNNGTADCTNTASAAAEQGRDRATTRGVNGEEESRPKDSNHKSPTKHEHGSAREGDKSQPVHGDVDDEQQDRKRRRRVSCADSRLATQGARRNRPRRRRRQGTIGRQRSATSAATDGQLGHTLRVHHCQRARAVRTRQHDAEVTKHFHDTPLEFFKSGAGEVRRGSKEVFISRGASAVATPKSTSRRTSGTKTLLQSQSATRSGRARNDGHDVGKEESAARTSVGNGKDTKARVSREPGQPSASPTDLVTVTDRFSVPPAALQAPPAL
ncbi:filaggrin-like [Bactrocera neohumeralis]|uniref:filaggrin-like n=1 Tax=Bactrocera neohumeralis TaxID=98809 RepID=UPI00216548E9|nr:filaggrin-like [Bactrocera neohumeralis]